MRRLSLLSAFALLLAGSAPAAARSAAFGSLRLRAGSASAPSLAPVPAPAAAYRATAADLGARLFAASQKFLGVPYVLGPLGEGADGEFDRDPLISFDGLDCTTFVEETMAFALGGEAGAQDVLRRIRYEGGVVSYQARNHFTEADWLPNNRAAGFLRDITAQVGGRRVPAVKKTISKRAWYAAKTEADLKGFGNEAPELRAQRLERLRALGAGLPDETVLLSYVPLAQLPALLPSIPSGTVVSLVREARDDKPTVVTHQFFIFDGPKGKIIRHAAQGKQVLDVPAADYIANLATYTSWKVLGFNLAAVTE